MSIFNREPLLIFSVNGAVYALRDFLEMQSLGLLPASTYSILQQFRIIVAALLLIPAKNQYQTRVQWTLLFMLMFGMSTYMCISAGAETDSSGGGSSSIVAVAFALTNVICACLGAVLSDKYMKVFKEDPTHVCIARQLFAWCFTGLILSFVPRLVGTLRQEAFVDIWSHGFFHGWDAMTVMVVGMTFIKSVSVLYFVALLDSILKNIAETFAVLVIYGYSILAPWVDKEFDPAACMAVLLVVMTCIAYIESKTVVDKAAKFDAMMLQ